MDKLLKIKKILAFITCGVIALSFAFVPNKNKNISIEAKTIAELEEEMKLNEEKIAGLQADLDALNKDEIAEKAYQETLSEQIILMQNNLVIVNEELNRLTNEVAEKEKNIQQLTIDIADQELDVQANMELFKERLRAMYVTGNDSITVAVLSSTDFYDMLSKVEMVNRIADHDNKLIENLKSQLDTLEATKSALETEKVAIEAKKAEQENKRDEFMEKQAEYNEAFEKSEEYLDSLKLEQQGKEESIENLENGNQEIEDEIAAIIKKAQEEEAARKAKEEADRKAKEEADRKAREEADRKAKEDANSSNSSDNSSSDSSSSSDYTAPSYEETPSGSSDFIWPTAGGFYISSGYGPRWGTTHKGIDIAGGSIRGSSALASRSGTVISVSNSCTHDYAKYYNCCGSGYGNYVIISHGDEYSTLYGHMTDVYVSVGDYVSAGTALGSIGCTGHSTGNHLHFEIRVNGSTVDPQNYV